MSQRNEHRSEPQHEIATKHAGAVALVTGASSSRGIGYEIARMLGLSGATVIITDLSSEIEARSKSLGELGIRCHATEHDVASENDWDRVFEDVVSKFGGLDILVNNAGIVIEEVAHVMAPEDFRKQIDVNLTGTFLGCRRALGHMIDRSKGGAIVNISSVASLRGYRALSGYNSSKAGIRMLTKTIALEGSAYGVRCNCIHPGMIWTDIMQVSADYLIETGQAKEENVRDLLLSDIPLGIFGEPSDIGNAVLFLTSDDSRFITGADLVIDGGMTI